MPRLSAHFSPPRTTFFGIIPPFRLPHLTPQVQELAPEYFPNVDPAKIQFISGRVPLENNTSSDAKALLKGAQSRNVSKCRTAAIISHTCATLSDEPRAQTSAPPCLPSFLPPLSPPSYRHAPRTMSGKSRMQVARRRQACKSLMTNTRTYNISGRAVDCRSF